MSKLESKGLVTNSTLRTALVTGGAGFIGSHLVDALVDNGVQVRVLDKLSTGMRGMISASVEYIAGDICDPVTFGDAFAGIDCVFHLAALARVPLSIAKPVETHLANVVGTLNVLIAARDARVGRLIFSGSSSVYGDQPTLPLVEEMTPHPMSPYALQKLTAEHYVRLFHCLYGINTLTLRYFNVYGPRMTLEGAYPTVIGAFLNARRRGAPLMICGDGEQTRDFTFVADVVRANLQAARSPMADGRAINIGAGCGVSVNRIAAIFAGEMIHVPARPGEPRHTLADLRQAETILGWRPQVSIEQGIAITRRYFEEDASESQRAG
jgi:nucleoside-diphosphate-sugar epimerase